MSGKSDDQLLEASIEWVVPDDLTVQYANQITIQNTDNEVYISFFHIRPPLILEGMDPSSVTSVKAECLAQIVITPEHAQRFLKALENNVKRIQSRQKEKA